MNQNLEVNQSGVIGCEAVSASEQIHQMNLSEREWKCEQKWKNQNESEKKV